MQKSYSKAIKIIENRLSMFEAQEAKSHQNLRLHFILTTFLQLLIFLYFLPGFYKINNVEPSFIDYLYFLTYTYFFLIILKTIIYGPIGLINYFIKSKYIPYIALLIDIILIAVFVLDCLVYNYQGMHVYDKMVIKLIMKNQGFERIEISWLTILSFVGAALLVTIITAAIFKLTEKIKLSKKKFLLSEIGISLLIISIFSFHFPNYFNAKADVINIFPFLVLAKKRPSNERLKTNYDLEKTKNITFDKKPDILFLFVESLRAESFTKENAPQLFQFFSQNNCVSPEYHFSGGHTTVYGTFSALYGLHGFHYDNFKKDNISSGGLNIFKENGYELQAGFSGVSNFSSYYDAGYMFNIFKDFKQFINRENPLDSDQKLYEWTKSLNSEMPLFRFSFFYSTHSNYYFPDKFALNKPFLKRNYSHLDSSFSPESFKIGLHNRYLNSIHFMDDLLMQQINGIADDRKENTIIIITGDHGQMFGEEGYYGHAHTNYINQLVKVPLYICTPEKMTIASKFSGHINIMPSLIDYLTDDSQYEKIKEVFNGVSIFKEQNKYLTINAPLFPYNRNKIAFVTPKMKFWLKKINETLDSYYPYRAATIDDSPVFGEEQRQEYEYALKLFQNETYKFLSKEK